MQYKEGEEKVINLFTELFGSTPSEVLPITAAGSSRQYFKLIDKDRKKIIGTVGTDKAENIAFFSLARHFGEYNLPVPEILAVSKDKMAYLQSDCGDVSLFEILGTPKAEPLLHEAMKMLARIQTIGARDIDFSVCFPQPSFDERTVRFDLNYFKYCFLKVTGLQFDEIALQDDFDNLEKILLRGMEECTTFMYRDFQSRNIMISDNGKLTAIDFQGGRRGPREYDAASFLWQAKAGFPSVQKRELLTTYIKETSVLDNTFCPHKFLTRLPFFVLFRILQTLGAYGFRGLIERRPHFLTSISHGKRNLSTHFSEYPDLVNRFPYLYKISNLLIENE